ncbi:hypothetical protein ACWCQM_06885 [Streptomyces sp. NPDC002125]
MKQALEDRGLTVYIGGTPGGIWTPPDKFAVLYPDPGVAGRASLGGERTDFRHLCQITCVGGDPERAMWVADQTRKALDRPLTVAGRLAWQPEDQGGPPLQRDDDMAPPLWYVPVLYLIQSIPS